MNYKKFDNLRPLPDNLKEECIQYGETCLKNNVERIVFGVDDNKESSSFNTWALPSDTVLKINNFYNIPKNSSVGYILQAITGSNRFFPHVDDPSMRTSPIILYVLKSGGDNIKNVWYKLKDEYKHVEFPFNTGIPYSYLDEVESHYLEEDMWHQLSVSTIHSVENQESTRYALYMYGIEDLNLLANDYK